MLALETRSLTKAYGHRHVVSNFNMHVPKGSVYGFVGKNGAGKSTVMKMVDHLVHPTSGCIYLFGQESAAKEQEILRRVGSLIEDPGVLPDMSTLDNLMCKALAIGLVNPKERCLEMLEIIGLKEAASKRVKKLSLGMKQRLGVGLALLGSPDLLLLDEPFNGLDPEGTRELRALIVRLNKEQSVTVVISSHVLDQLDRDGISHLVHRLAVQKRCCVVGNSLVPLKRHPRGYRASNYRLTCKRLSHAGTDSSSPSGQCSDGIAQRQLWSLEHVHGRGFPRNSSMGPRSHRMHRVFAHRRNRQLGFMSK